MYETILAFEERNRMVIVDISAFDDPDEMSHGINMVLDEAGVDRVVLMGQSLSGVLAQLYFRRNPDRVDAVLLTNTLAPKRERCRKWTRLLLAWIPFPVLRVLLRRKMRRLGHFDKEIPAAVEERRRFAGELMASQVDRCFTRERISRILKLGWCFNEEGEYSASELCDWRGPALLITSTDRRTRAEDPFIQLPCASRRSSPPRAEPWSPR
ncbi:MAG: alpha/beta hydrolase [bacterium]|nr:alpha/beta hydrolase [bacterium]